MTPQEVADRYFACVRTRDLDGWMALFAEGANYILPNGKAFTGLAAIREVQQMVFQSGAPTPSPQSKLVDGNRMAVEVQVELPDGAIRRTANLYTLDDEGRIARLSVFMQGA